MDVLDRKIDVICQHSSDGLIIPIKIRMIDDDGEWQIYRIKSYRVLSCPGNVQLPNNVDTSLNFWIFECKVEILGNVLGIKLMYNIYEGIWKIMG